MIQFYISKKDIKKAFAGASNYKINQLWSATRDYCEKRKIPMFDSSTIPTQAFCDYMKLDKKEFLEAVKGEVNANND